MSTCSLCKSTGSTKATCPLNPKATNPNPRKHPMAKNGGGAFKTLQRIFESDSAKRKRLQKLQQEEYDYHKSKLRTHEIIGKKIKAGRYVSVINPDRRTMSVQIFPTRELKDAHCNKCNCCITEEEELHNHNLRGERLRRQGMAMIGIT